jgi:hypothetical protein
MVELRWNSIKSQIENCNRLQEWFPAQWFPGFDIVFTQECNSRNSILQKQRVKCNRLQPAGANTLAEIWF